MVALNVALTVKEKIKGVLGYSGGIILTKSGKIEINSKPIIATVSCFVKLELDLGVSRGVRARSVVN